MLSSAFLRALHQHCICRPLQLRRVLVREACHHHDCKPVAFVSGAVLGRCRSKEAFND